MAPDTVLTIFIIVVALALLGEALALGAFYVLALRPLLRELRAVAAFSAEPLRVSLRQLREISEGAKQGADHGDRLLTEAFARWRMQLDLFDSELSEKTASLERTVALAAHSVKAPARRISAFGEGLSAAIETFLAPHNGRHRLLPDRLTGVGHGSEPASGMDLTPED